MSGRPYTPAEEETVRRMWLAGEHVSAIQDHVPNRSEKSIYNLAARLGLSARGVPRVFSASGVERWTPEEDGTLQRMHACGETFEAIARALGRSRNAVLGRAWRHGMRTGGQIAPKPVAPVVPPRQPAWMPPADSRGCLWLHPKGADWSYCGEAPVAGKPFCLGHCRIAYRRFRLPSVMAAS